MDSEAEAEANNTEAQYWLDTYPILMDTVAAHEGVGTDEAASYLSMMAGDFAATSDEEALFTYLGENVEN